MHIVHKKIIIPEQAQLDDLFLFGLIDGSTVVFSTSFNEHQEEKDDFKASDSLTPGIGGGFPI